MAETVAEAPRRDDRNAVSLVGRLAAAAEQRTMPSGDVMAAFRVVVARPPARKAAPRAPAVDTIDCVAWRGDVRRTVLGWAAGDTVAVVGALRRRFWRAGAAAVSRTEVEVTRARRVARAP